MFDNKFIQKSLPKKGKKYYDSKKSFNENAIEKNLQNKINNRAKAAPNYENLNLKFKLETELIKKQLEFLFSEQLEKNKIDVYDVIKEVIESSLDKVQNKKEAIQKFLFDEREKEIFLDLCKKTLLTKFK